MSIRALKDYQQEESLDKSCTFFRDCSSFGYIMSGEYEETILMRLIRLSEGSYVMVSWEMTIRDEVAMKEIERVLFLRRFQYKMNRTLR